jgi:hypothetical protein
MLSSLKLTRLPAPRARAPSFLPQINNTCNPLYKNTCYIYHNLLLSAFICDQFSRILRVKTANEDLPYFILSYLWTTQRKLSYTVENNEI